MLVFGSSIGEGNYSHPQGEIIWLEKPINSNLLLGLLSQSDVSATGLNLEADTSGKLPKGAKAVYVSARVNDSGSAGADCYLFLRTGATQIYQFVISPYGLANDSSARFSGWQACDSNGDFDYQIEATGANTFDIADFRYTAVQLR